MTIPVINVADEIHELGIIVNFVVFENLMNRKLEGNFEMCQKKILSELNMVINKELIRKDPVLEGYRYLRTQLGISKNKYICSSEALLTFLLKKRILPHVNLLVDIYNLVSVKTHISIGAHALDKIVQRLDFRITTGNEQFVPMGSNKRVEIEKGEYAYIDGSNEVLCRLDHRQCHKTRIIESTQSCLLIVQGNSFTTREQINYATDELIKMIKQYCGGDAEAVGF